MSKAPRPARLDSRSRSCAGHDRLLGQRMSLSPSFSGASVVPHAGQSVGMTNSRSVPSRRSTTGPRISGMTSPALRSTTVSPMRTPLRCTSVGVVQRGALDRGPGDDDRLHDPERRDPAGATDVDLDVEELGVDLLGRVLEGDRPARRARGGAEPALHRDLVDLDDDPVDLVLDVVAVLPRVRDEGVAPRRSCRRPGSGWRPAGPTPRARRRPRSAASGRTPRACRCRGRACAAHDSR